MSKPGHDWGGSGARVHLAACWIGGRSIITARCPNHDDSVVVDREVRSGLRPMAPTLMMPSNQRPAC